MSTAEIADLLAAFRSGELSLDEVAAQFRRRTWARARRPEPEDPQGRADQIDPALPVPGSIDEITTAFDRGELTWEQYRVLAHAVADSINAKVSGDPAASV
jgi:hypothetical protein